LHMTWKNITPKLNQYYQVFNILYEQNKKSFENFKNFILI